MKYSGFMLVVRDLERAKQFYCGVLGMAVTVDFGANITLDDVVSLQTLETWTGFIHKDESAIRFGNHASELYFEEADFDGLLERLALLPELEYLHPVEEQTWGQRTVSLYDPDHHIVEIGEELTAVARRFQAAGMSPAEIARRMDVAEEYVRQWIGAN